MTKVLPPAKQKPQVSSCEIHLSVSPNNITFRLPQISGQILCLVPFEADSLAHYKYFVLEKDQLDARLPGDHLQCSGETVRYASVCEADVYYVFAVSVNHYVHFIIHT